MTNTVSQRMEGTPRPDGKIRREFALAFDYAGDDAESRYVFQIDYLQVSAGHPRRTITYCGRASGHSDPAHPCTVGAPHVASRSGQRHTWKLRTILDRRPYCGELEVTLRIGALTLIDRQRLRSRVQATAVAKGEDQTAPAVGGAQPAPPEPPADRAALLRGDYQRKGAYQRPMSGGFTNPNLQGWLVEVCQKVNQERPGKPAVDPAALAVTSGEGTEGEGGGDAEVGRKAGLPSWLWELQVFAATSTQWREEVEQTISRLLEAFFYTYFVEELLGPEGVAMPASVEEFLAHLGKSLYNNKAQELGGYHPPPGDKRTYCAVSSSLAFKRGLARHGYTFPGESNRIPGGVIVYSYAASTAAWAQTSMRMVFDPRPGDVLEIRTLGSPASGHVVTVVHAKIGADRQGEIWFVSGNAANKAIACDFARVDPGNYLSGEKPEYAEGKPAKGSIRLISRAVNHQLQPEYAARMGPNLLGWRRITRQPGTFPAPNRAGELAAQSATEEMVDVPDDCPHKRSSLRENNIELHFTLCACCTPSPTRKCWGKGPACGKCPHKASAGS